MKGRPPLPTQLHKARGNPGRRKHNEAEPKPPLLALVRREWAWPAMGTAHLLIDGRTACKRDVEAGWQRAGHRPMDVAECRRCAAWLASAPRADAAPDWLDGYAREAWDRVLPMLQDMRVVTTADLLALELLCEDYAEYRAAREDVREHGLTYIMETMTGGQMVRLRPTASYGGDAWRRLLAVLVQFGMTPSSRSRVSSLPQDTPDEFAEFEKTGRG